MVEPFYKELHTGCMSSKEGLLAQISSYLKMFDMYWSKIFSLEMQI